MTFPARREFRKNAKKQAARGNAVTDCLIERCGQEFYGAVGIWVGMAHHTTVAHNLIRHLPYTGISVGPNLPPVRYNATPEENIRLESNTIQPAKEFDSDRAAALLPKAGHRSLSD